MLGHQAEVVLMLNILKDLGHQLPHSAKILDFGCGKGDAVSVLSERGFDNVYGYDIENYLDLKNPADTYRFIFSPEALSTHKSSFDFIFSNQVFEHVMNYPETIQSVFNLLKPGGISLHFFPSKWRLIEPHIKVPLGGVFSQKPYLDFWARLGVRNEYQQDKGWREVSECNYQFCQNHLNYLSSKELKSIFRRTFDRVEFREDLLIKHSPGRLQKLPSALKSFPGLGNLMRALHARTVFLEKK